MKKMKTYESTIVENEILYGRWHEGFKDEDTGKVISILRYEAICYENEMSLLKKKQSRLNKDKWAIYVFNEKEMEFPKLQYYLWKRGKAPKI
jgi:hypothetical protein